MRIYGERGSRRGDPEKKYICVRESKLFVQEASRYSDIQKGSVPQERLKVERRLSISGEVVRLTGRRGVH